MRIFLITLFFLYTFKGFSQFKNYKIDSSGFVSFNERMRNYVYNDPELYNRKKPKIEETKGWLEEILNTNYINTVKFQSWILGEDNLIETTKSKLYHFLDLNIAITNTDIIITKRVEVSFKKMSKYFNNGITETVCKGLRTTVETIPLSSLDQIRFISTFNRTNCLAIRTKGSRISNKISDIDFECYSENLKSKGFIEYSDFAILPFDLFSDHSRYRKLVIAFLDLQDFYKPYSTSPY